MNFFVLCRISTLLFFLFCLSACKDSYEVIFHRVIIADKNKIAQDTLIYNPLNNSYFSRLKQKKTKGLACYFDVPVENQNHRTYVVFEGRIRSNYAHSNSSFILTAIKKDEVQLCWRALNLKTSYIGVNNWTHFKDSIFLPPNFNGKKYNLINMFAFLGNSDHELFDVDTMDVKIKILKN